MDIENLDEVIKYIKEHNDIFKYSINNNLKLLNKILSLMDQNKSNEILSNIITHLDLKILEEFTLSNHNKLNINIFTQIIENLTGSYNFSSFLSQILPLIISENNNEQLDIITKNSVQNLKGYDKQEALNIIFSNCIKYSQNDILKKYIHEADDLNLYINKSIVLKNEEFFDYIINTLTNEQIEKIKNNENTFSSFIQLTNYNYNNINISFIEKLLPFVNKKTIVSSLEISLFEEETYNSKLYYDYLLKTNQFDPEDIKKTFINLIKFEKEESFQFCMEILDQNTILNFFKNPKIKEYIDNNPNNKIIETINDYLLKETLHEELNYNFTHANNKNKRKF